VVSMTAMGRKRMMDILDLADYVAANIQVQKHPRSNHNSPCRHEAPSLTGENLPKGPNKHHKVEHSAEGHKGKGREEPGYGTRPIIGIERATGHVHPKP